MFAKRPACVRRLFMLAAAAMLSIPAASAIAGTLSYQTVLLYNLWPNPGVLNDVVSTPDGVVAVGTYDGATVWTAAGGTGLQPPEPPVGPFLQSDAFAASGNQQVGFIDYTYDNQTHAMLWSGSSQSMVDLHPSQFSQFDCSVAKGIGGSQQVGYLYNYSSTNAPTMQHAVLWAGTAASAIDLNPPGFLTSQAIATDGVQQVGMASTAFGTQGRTDPILWRGTADSAVDLAPTKLANIGGTQVLGVGGNQQVGTGFVRNSPLPENHAILWSGSAGSAVDLGPSGFTDSFALGTNGSIQAGYGADFAHNDNAKWHAIAWNGSADSAVDLHAQLPSTFTESQALSVDAAGNVYGYAMAPYVYAAPYSGYYAVEWVAVPEPGGITVLAMGLLALPLLRRQRCHATLQQ